MQVLPIQAISCVWLTNIVYVVNQDFMLGSFPCAVTSLKIFNLQKYLTLYSAVFVVGFRCHDDLKADDMGSWVHKGKHVRYYEISRLTSGEVYGGTNLKTPCT